MALYNAPYVSEAEHATLDHTGIPGVGGSGGGGVGADGALLLPDVDNLEEYPESPEPGSGKLINHGGYLLALLDSDGNEHTFITPDTLPDPPPTVHGFLNLNLPAPSGMGNGLVWETTGKRQPLNQSCVLDYYEIVDLPAGAKIRAVLFSIFNDGSITVYRIDPETNDYIQVFARWNLVEYPGFYTGDILLGDGDAPNADFGVSTAQGGGIEEDTIDVLTAGRYLILAHYSWC